MPVPMSLPDSETIAWFWFAYESGLGVRRAKQVILEHVLPEGLGLHDVLAAGPAAWTPVLALSESETAAAEAAYEQIDAVAAAVATWQAEGIGLLRLDQAEYPPTLRTHLRPEQRPLLLSYRGDLELLELPSVLALAGDAPDDEAVQWTTDTLIELGGEGALALAVARPGLDASLVRALLQAGTPFALVLAQGLASYQPPANLAAAQDANLTLLLSPFRPDQPPPDSAHPLLPHAATFAQALAHALLLITPPYPVGLLPEQPCFLRPGLPKTVGCQRSYAGPEDLFIELVETPTAAAEANATGPLPTIDLPAVAEVTAPLAKPEAPEPPVDAEALIGRLSELGNVPEALKARLRSKSDH